VNALLAKLGDDATREEVTAHNIDEVFVILHSLNHSMGGKALLRVELLHPHFIKSAEHLAGLVEINKQQIAMDKRLEFGLALTTFYRSLMDSIGPAEERPSPIYTGEVARSVPLHTDTAMSPSQ
jgi:hypothetical protein